MAWHGKIATLAGALLLCMTGNGAGAQVAPAEDEWVLATDPSRDVTVAGVKYTSGFILGVECHAGELNVWISGLPENTVMGGRFARSLADGRSIDSYWTRSTSGTRLTSASAARDARSLKAGGVLALVSIEHSGAPLNIHLDLPTESEAIDHVLTACGRPLTDPRDTLLDVNSLLVEGPRLMIQGDISRHRGLRLEISCIIADGRLSKCQSDHETPDAPEIGAITARRANGQRLRFSDPVAAEGRLIDIVLTGSRVYRQSPG